MKTISFLAISLLVTISGCAVNTYNMNPLNNHLELRMENLEISEPVTAEAKVVKFLGIDFQRLFRKEKASDPLVDYSTESSTSIYYSSRTSDSYTSSSTSLYSSVTSSISRLLSPLFGSEASAYALYKIFHEHPEYDVFIYPKVEEKTEGIPFVFTITRVRVTTRLAKLKIKE